MSDALPAGWVSAPLSALGTWLGGGTPSKAVPEYWTNGTIPWVSPKDMKRLVIDSAQDQITEAALKGSATNLVPARSVLMVTRSGILEHTFPVSVNSVPVTINQDLKAWTPSGVDSLYAAYYLRSRQQDVLRECSKDGTTVSSIDFDQLAKFPMLVAPRAEQQRIVSRIEELFSEIDEGERALERVGRLVERYRQSVLKAAVTGELTREWRAQHSTAKTPASDDLPAGWRRVAVEELCAVQTGATPKRGEARYYENGAIPWVTSGAVNARRITEANELITQSAIDETNAKVFPAGTLIVAMYGEGKTRGKVSELGIAAATNQACAALLCADLEPGVKGYLRLFFEQHYDELRDQAAGGVQPNLNLSLIKQTVLPQPPQPEAREICNQVAVQLSQAEALGLELTRGHSAATALRQSILKAAFSGQLVPQDPNDEPAAALLARIASQAGEAPSAPKRRSRPASRPASRA